MDLATFRIMRISQYSAWGEELLESCLADLRAAQNQGRNLMTEKYARMMKTTFLDEYPAIEKSLPPLDPAAARQIEDLVACHQSKAFEESVDEAIDALKRQIDKFKSKSEK